MDGQSSFGRIASVGGGKSCLQLDCGEVCNVAGLGLRPAATAYQGLSFCNQSSVPLG